ncbi:MAG: hypothetical protein JXA64_04820 [Candidatus Fermentibacteraceae bacterium]|nr:hypothetical protein [Candidatus Fermentibacteraceae bacterium]MBN2608417.1 hypothetical protein [Candidatus Fermentibacteraceae bacterium]
MNRSTPHTAIVTVAVILWSCDDPQGIIAWETNPANGSFVFYLLETARQES